MLNDTVPVSWRLLGACERCLALLHTYLETLTTLFLLSRRDRAAYSYRAMYTPTIRPVGIGRRGRSVQLVYLGHATLHETATSLRDGPMTRRSLLRDPRRFLHRSFVSGNALQSHLAQWSFLSGDHQAILVRVLVLLL